MATDKLEAFCREWADFDTRHPEMAHHGIGGLTWAFMRSIAECPHCPGVYRVPPDGRDWVMLRCPNCGGVWEFVEQLVEKPRRGGGGEGAAQDGGREHGQRADQDRATSIRESGEAAPPQARAAARMDT